MFRTVLPSSYPLFETLYIICPVYIKRSMFNGLWNIFFCTEVAHCFCFVVQCTLHSFHNWVFDIFQNHYILQNLATYITRGLLVLVILNFERTILIRSATQNPLTESAEFDGVKYPVLWLFLLKIPWSNKKRCFKNYVNYTLINVEPLPNKFETD